MHTANYLIIRRVSRDLTVIQRQARGRHSKQAGGKRIEWAPRSLKHLRSTFASRVSEHVSPFQLKDLLGHSSVTTSEKHYVAADSDLSRKLQAAFERNKAEAR